MHLCGSPQEGGVNEKEGLSRSVSVADVAARRAGKPLSRKLVVVGDGACGKTSLLNVYEPTVFENHVKDLLVDDVPVELSLWDTAGQEDFARLRSLSYADTHVVMLCFSVDQPTSLENIENKWIDEILELCPGVKLCLIALKCDKREEGATIQALARYQQHPVQYEEGLAVARRIRASRYLECSAKVNRGVDEAFQEAARVAIGARRKGETRGSRVDHGGEEGWTDRCVVC